MMRLPCQIIKTGRRIVYRLLSWNPWQGRVPADRRNATPPDAQLTPRYDVGVRMPRSAAAPDPQGTNDSKTTHPTRPKPAKLTMQQ